MKLKSSHLIVIIGGGVLVFLLSLLPKYVVSDKEKRIKETENKVKQELTSDNSSHQAEQFDSKKASSLKAQIATAAMPSKLNLIDSLGSLYKNAFMLDSAMNLYSSYADLENTYFIKSIRDGLTGFQMAQNDDKKRYYQSLCEEVLSKGLKKHPNYLDLQVEELRFKTLLSAFNHEPPIQWVGKLKELVVKHPNLTSGHIALAEFYQAAGKSKEAIEKYLRVVEIDKDNLQAHLELVNLYLQEQKNISAKEHVLILQELNKTTKDSFIEDFVNKSLKQLEH